MIVFECIQKSVQGKLIFYSMLGEKLLLAKLLHALEFSGWCSIYYTWRTRLPLVPVIIADHRIVIFSGSVQALISNFTRLLSFLGNKTKQIMHYCKEISLCQVEIFDLRYLQQRLGQHLKYMKYWIIWTYLLFAMILSSSLFWEDNYWFFYSNMFGVNCKLPGPFPLSVCDSVNTVVYEHAAKCSDSKNLS